MRSRYADGLALRKKRRKPSRTSSLFTGASAVERGTRTACSFERKVRPRLGLIVAWYAWYSRSGATPHPVRPGARAVVATLVYHGDHTRTDGRAEEIFVHLDAETWLAVTLVALAALLLILTTAAEAAGVIGGRGRNRVTAVRGTVTPRALQHFTEERDRLLSGLALARLLCVTCASVAVFSMVARHSGVSLRPAVASVTLTVLVAGAIQAVPRVLITQNPERWQLLLRPLRSALMWLFYVLALAVDQPAQLLLRLKPFRPATPSPAAEDEDLVALVELEESHGGIERQERDMIRAVFELEETTAREMMVPRIYITAVEVGSTLQQAAELVASRGFSRLPLYEDNLDNILGVVYAKDVLARFAHDEQKVDLRDIARPAFFVPESKRLDELLQELRSRRIHVALVVDEYGGTAGLLIEDVVEEIVGDIEDEYDRPAVGVQTSLGRLFDAVAVVVHGRGVVDYEAHAAIELEGIAVDEDDDTGPGDYAPELLNGAEPGGPSVMRTNRMWKTLLTHLRCGESPSRISARFHDGVAWGFINAAANARIETGINQVALSGGCMHNRRLVRLLREGLQAEGFEVFQHRQVSPGDGGLSYGQAVVAAAILTRR